MVVKNIHIMGIDPGGKSGWYLITVPRLCIFGTAPSEIVEIDRGLFAGDENVQAIEIARLVREVQSLDYKTGPAVVTERWDQDPTFKSTDPEALSPCRINAKLSLLRHQGLMADATLTEQSRTIAKSTATDERMMKWGLWVAAKNQHDVKDINDAGRHAITALRRARANLDLAKQLWPYRGLWQ